MPKTPNTEACATIPLQTVHLEEALTPSVFISYRREDCPGHAGRLFDHLRARFGEASVFMDVTDIEAGVDFVDVLQRAVGSCDVLLAIVGREWLSCTDRNGRRRLDDPQDFIRLEIGIALTRNVRVIPVLVEGAAIPRASELPPDLEGLTRRQAVELRDARWNADVENLAGVLDRVLRPRPPAIESTRPRFKRARLWGFVAVALVAALVGVLTLVPRGSTPSSLAPQNTSATPIAAEQRTPLQAEPPATTSPGPEARSTPAPEIERRAPDPVVSRGAARLPGNVTAGSGATGSNAPPPRLSAEREGPPVVDSTDQNRSPRPANGFLGLRLSNAPADASGASGRGAIVESLTPGGPAANAGLLVGDLIVEYGGAQVSDAAGFGRLAAASTPGEAVLIRVRRAGAGRTLEAVVGDRANAPGTAGTVLIQYAADDDRSTATGLASMLSESINDARYAVRTSKTSRRIGGEGQVLYSASGFSALAGTLARRAESALSQRYGRRVAFTEVVDPKVAARTVFVLMPGKASAPAVARPDPVITIVYPTADDARMAEELANFLRTLRSGWKYTVVTNMKATGGMEGKIAYNNERLTELAQILARDPAAWISRAYGRRVALKPTLTPGSIGPTDHLSLWLPNR